MLSLFVSEILRCTCMLCEVARVRVTLTTNQSQLNLILLCTFTVYIHLLIQSSEKKYSNVTILNGTFLIFLFIKFRMRRTTKVDHSTIKNINLLVFFFYQTRFRVKPQGLSLRSHHFKHPFLSIYS